MYLPDVFEETRPEVLWDLVARQPLGLLISAGPEGPLASPLPFLGVEAEGRLRLTCHLARPNPHLEALAGAGDCLVVFQGAEAYVTPSWYPSKAETERVTPTWNYEMVQVRGIPSLRPERDWLAAHVAALTAALPVVDAELATAAKALADAVQASVEKRAVVTAKQAEVDAAGRQLDALQGIQN